MMEQPHSRECHDHAVFVACIDDEVIPDRAARLCHIENAALSRTLDIVGEREERVAAQRYARDFGKISLLLFLGERLGADGEELFPYVFAQNVLALVGKVNVDDVVFIGTPYPFGKLQIQNLVALAQMPKVGFAACKAGTMDATAAPRPRRSPARPPQNIRSLTAYTSK